MTKIELKLRYLIAKLTGALIRIILVLSYKNKSKNLVRKLRTTQQNINPNIFAGDDFLRYIQRKKEGFVRNSNIIKTLVLRGSNADFGFYSPDWNNSYNLGLTSSDLHGAYFLYYNYRNSLTNLQNIIIFGSVSFIGFNLIRTNERYRATAYKFFFNIPYQESGIINSRFEKLIFKKCSALITIATDNEYYGYENNNTLTNNIKASLRVSTHYRENRREPDQLQWLIKLRDLIKHDNKKLFVIIPPYRSDYRNLLPGYYELFEKILKIEGLEILNFYDTDIFNSDDFADTDHLNKKGAIKLTSEIKKHIN